MTTDQDIQKFLEKVKKLEKGEKLDLSSDEDLSIGIMNLISIEEHFFFTYNKTQDRKYLELLDQVREMRKSLLKRIIKDYEGEVWCLPPGTCIYTNPAPARIEDVVPGEKVLTANGNFSSVSRVLGRDYKGEMVLIHPYYSDSLMLTPEHPVLCASGVREKQKTIWRKELKKPSIVWKMAMDLKDTDFLLFPRYKKSESLNEIEWEYHWQNSGCFRKKKESQEKEFTRRIKILVDSDLLRLIGLYLSEGSISDRRYLFKGSKKHNYNLYFSFGKKEKALIEETKKLFKKIFGVELKEQITHTNTDLVCAKRVIVDFFGQFGRNSYDKQLPLWVMNLPGEKLVYLIWGLVKGDGGVGKYDIEYFTVSEKLAYQLRLVLFKLGIIHSLKKRKIKGESEINGRVIKSYSQGFLINFSGDSGRFLDEKIGLDYKATRTSGNFGYVLDDYVMIPIRKLERAEYEGKVYNLEVPGEESYTTFTGVVHNCISKHLLAAAMRLMEVGTKALTKGDKKEAEEMFQKSYQLYSLFWGLNLGAVGVEDVKQENSKEVVFLSEDKKPGVEKKLSVFEKLGQFVQKAIDCCKE